MSNGGEGGATLQSLLTVCIMLLWVSNGGGRGGGTLQSLLTVCIMLLWVSNGGGGGGGNTTVVTDCLYYVTVGE